MTKTRWKSINGFPGYKVSNMGTISKGGKLCRLSYSSGGLCITLINGADGCTKRVARLVGEYFCAKYKPNLYPTYRDGNFQNCRPSNIKWVKRSHFVKKKAPSALEEIA